MVFVAGKTVWSMPERFKVVCIPCKALYKCSALLYFTLTLVHTDRCPHRDHLHSRSPLQCHSCCPSSLLDTCTARYHSTADMRRGRYSRLDSHLTTTSHWAPVFSFSLYNVRCQSERTLTELCAIDSEYDWKNTQNFVRRYCLTAESLIFKYPRQNITVRRTRSSAIAERPHSMVG